MDLNILWLIFRPYYVVGCLLLGLLFSSVVVHVLEFLDIEMTPKINRVNKNA